MNIILVWGMYKASKDFYGLPYFTVVTFQMPYDSLPN